jgi:putative transposase
MENRKAVYSAARDLHPHRFNRGIRKWNLPETVALNPTDEDKSKLEGIG